MKYWEVLLTKQRERGKAGLTLPFLIGSQEYLPSSHIQNGIEDIILDILSSNSFETCIRPCLDTHTLILEIRNPKNNVFFPTYNNETQSNLSIAILLKSDLGDSIKLLIEKLIEEFQEPITKGLFSAEPNVNGRSPIWNPFSYDDITFIQQCFAEQTTIKNRTP